MNQKKLNQNKNKSDILNILYPFNNAKNAYEISFGIADDRLWCSIREKNTDKGDSIDLYLGNNYKTHHNKKVINELGEMIFEKMKELIDENE